MYNYEAEKFISIFIRTIVNGKDVKISFAKDKASKKEIDAIFSKIDANYIVAWENYCKYLRKQFKLQREFTDYRSYLNNKRRPGKKNTAQFGLPIGTIIL